MLFVWLEVCAQHKALSAYLRYIMDGVNQWPDPASLSGNVLNADNMTPNTEQLAAKIKLN